MGGRKSRERGEKDRKWEEKCQGFQEGQRSLEQQTLNKKKGKLEVVEEHDRSWVGIRNEGEM